MKEGMEAEAGYSLQHLAALLYNEAIEWVPQ